MRYSPLAHRTALLFGAGDDADDIVQDAFVKAFRSLDGFRQGGSFRPWLLAIVVNETRNLRRGARRRASLALRVARLPPDGATLPVTPDAELLEYEKRAALWRAVRALPGRERAVVTCRYLLELSEVETVAALGCPAGTVKSRLSRALRRLHAQLQVVQDTEAEVDHG